MRRSFGRGVFVSRTAFEFEGETPTIPAGIFLALISPA